MAEKKVPLSISQKSAETKKVYRIAKLKINRQTLKKALLIIAIPIAVTILAFTGIMISYLADAPALDMAALEAIEASYIYDRDDNEIAQLHAAENRIVLPIEEIPEQLQKAFIAIEDERFRKHRGVDTIGFGRAILVNIRDRSFSQGASTITQQLIRNAMLDPGKKIKRKVQEMWLALKLERLKSKDEILEMYLNRICFGNGIYGVEAASQAYFGKSVGKLKLSETALLAGIVRSPSYYNPFNDKKAATSRMKLVLGNMKRLGYISSEEYEKAVDAKLKFAKPTTQAYPHPYFVDYVVHHELVDILEGIPEFNTQEEAYEAIYNGGLRVYTTMNTGYQEHLENVLGRADLYPRTVYIDMDRLNKAVQDNNGRLPGDYWSGVYNDEKKGIPQPQSAMVLTDPKNGEVWALGGGREYLKNRNELLRYLSLRQPGSAIKPILEYGPSFNEGLLGLGSVLDDSPLAFPGWWPENVDSAFRGMVTVRRALAHSINIPAIRAYGDHIGLEKGAEMAFRMGITTYDPQAAQPDLPWAIGSRETTALDMAQAYSVLANNGIKMDMHTVRRIENRHGEVLYEHKASPEQILSPEAAFMTTSVLQDVVTQTTARGLSGLGRPLAAKTGTTDDARDIYLAAYAPNVVATFWMGYDIKEMGGIASGWNYTSGMIRTLFQEVFKTLPQENFAPQPAGVVRVEVCTKSGLLPNEHCREAGTVQADYFLRNHVPRLTCDKHVQLDICEASGLLAGEFCPADQIVQQVFFERPDYIVTDSRWKRGAGRGPADAKEIPPEEVCDLHTEFSGELTSFTAIPLGGGQVVLNWRYRGADVKEFQLYRRAQGEKAGKKQLISALGKKARTYTDKQLQPGTYIYTLQAVSGQGTLSEPIEAEVTLGESIFQLPGNPENLRFELLEGNTVRLAWDAADDRATEFIIFRNGSIIGRTDYWQEWFEDEDLEPGEYTYSVQARGFLGDSERSGEVRVVITGDSGRNGGSAFARLFDGRLHHILTACWSRVCLLF